MVCLPTSLLALYISSFDPDFQLTKLLSMQDLMQLINRSLSTGGIMHYIYHRFISLMFFIIYLSGGIMQAQDYSKNLSVQYEELNALQFKAAVKAAKNTCIIPFGVMEKHGPHLPVGTDLINVRELARRAAHQEYAVVFPAYYFGQIFEAKHQPGTLAYSRQAIWNLLQETCAELARNGLRKIIILNGHGGNNNFLKYFCQAQLESPKNYVVYLHTPPEDAAFQEQLKQQQQSEFDYHGGEVETAVMLAHRPDLVNLEIADEQSGADLNRLRELQYALTGIWWYARFPNHYAGDASAARQELGSLMLEHKVKNFVAMLKSVKADQKAMELQETFFKQAQNPLKTEQ